MPSTFQLSMHMKHIKHISVLASCALLAGAFLASPAQAQGKYKNFRVAVYVLRGAVNQWSDPQVLAAAYDEMTRQVQFDKVYLEFAGGHSQANEATLDPIKKFFTDRGILVSAAIVPNG